MQIGKQKIADGALLFACNVNDKSNNSAKIPHNRKVPIPFSISLLYAKNILFYFIGNASYEIKTPRTDAHSAQG